MNQTGFFDNNHTIQNRRILVLLILTVITIGMNFAGIYFGVTIILAHFLYFPIILAAYWYPERCYPFLIFIAVIYGAIIAYVSYPPDLVLIAITLTRVAIFTTIGVIVSLLSFNLRRSEQLLTDIIEFLPDATFAINKEGVVIAWNKAMEEMTGVKKSEILNKDDYEYAVPFYGERRPIMVDLVLNDDPAVEEYYPNLIKESGKYTSDILIPHFKSQSSVYLHFSATTLKDPRGNVTGAIETIRDITDIVMTESALSNTTQKLNTLSGILRTDISNNLDLISGCLHEAEREDKGPAISSLINKMKGATEGIRRRLEVSRDFQLLGTKPPAWVDLQEEISKAAGKLNFGGIEFRSWAERLEIFADPGLSTVFYHLFENPLKFRGKLSRLIVTYYIQDDMCHIIVEDDGPGIEDSEKGRLFNQFNDEGYGRGLYLSHEILSITNIEIDERGSFGTGARFELIVPPGGFRINEETGEEPAEGELLSKDELPDMIPEVRELKSCEFNKANEIWTDYHNTTGDPWTDRLFGVFLNGRLVSVARCRRRSDGFEVDGVFTPDEYRNKGYANLVVGALVEACHNYDLYMFSVSHLTEFYRRYGFNEIALKELPEGIRERYSWAQGNLEGAGVQPMARFHTDMPGSTQ